MKGYPSSAVPDVCSGVCSPTSSADELNRECFCLSVDSQALHKELELALTDQGLSEAVADSHPHLFSALPVYVSHRHIEQTASVVTAIEEVVASPAYRSAVMSWSPEIARFDPGSPGGLLGFDFHLGPGGPRLIEINTNPGGVLLNALLGKAQRACIPELTMPPTDASQVEARVLQATMMEWQLQRGSAPLEYIVIVDESPKQQYLYPEFVLFRELFRRHGYRAEICGPEELALKHNRLCLGDTPVDFVYNRLTDFSLQQPSQNVLRAAYLSGVVGMSPHPRAHALYADKRNLSLLGNRDFLQASGTNQTVIEILIAAVPETQLVTLENREAMWIARRRLFFKPAAGFGSKASYRGDKLTRRVWDEICDGIYVAQELMPPSERRVNSASDPFKVDIRCYSYRGKVLLYAARMYKGQTTNFRTKGGGFAPVLTTRKVLDRD